MSGTLTILVILVVFAVLLLRAVRFAKRNRSVQASSDYGYGGDSGGVAYLGTDGSTSDIATHAHAHGPAGAHDHAPGPGHHGVDGASHDGGAASHGGDAGGGGHGGGDGGGSSGGDGGGGHG